MNKKLLRHIFKGVTNPKNKSYIKVAKDIHYIMPDMACAVRVEATDNPFIPGKAFDAAPDGVNRMFNKGADAVKLLLTGELTVDGCHDARTLRTKDGREVYIDNNYLKFLSDEQQLSLYLDDKFVKSIRDDGIVEAVIAPLRSRH
ncbi:unknown [Dialister sp. CAG:588]|nr:unknown [Dialister sp. CAG:588]